VFFRISPDALEGAGSLAGGSLRSPPAKFHPPPWGGIHHRTHEAVYSGVNPSPLGKNFYSRILRVLAVNAGRLFHRKDAKDAKKTPRSLVCGSAAPRYSARCFGSQDDWQDLLSMCPAASDDLQHCQSDEIRERILI